MSPSPPEGLTLVPITYREAVAFILRHHRHHAPARGQVFAIGAAIGETIVGVATAGRPVSRRLDDGWTLEVNDGCAGGRRPQVLYLRAQDFADYESVDEALVDVYQQLDDALANLGYSFDEDEVRAWLRGVVQGGESTVSAPREVCREGLFRVRASGAVVRATQSGGYVRIHGETNDYPASAFKPVPERRSRERRVRDLGFEARHRFWTRAKLVSNHPRRTGTDRRKDRGQGARVTTIDDKGETT